MKNVLTAIVALGLLSQVAQAAVVVDEDFSDPVLDPSIWDASGGFFLNTVAQNMMISNFSGSFGQKGGVGGLFSSTVGYASMTVTGNGVDPFAGNFNIGNSQYANTNFALVRVSFDNQASFEYDLDPNAVTRVEMVWNNSTDPNSQPFEMDSGWAGMIGSGSAVSIINGDPNTAVFRTVPSGGSISPGDPADRFGFWVAGGTPTTKKAVVIDDLLVWDSLTPAAGTLGDFDGNGVVDGLDFLEWQRNPGVGDLADWEANYGVGGLTAISGVPEPTTLALLLPVVIGTVLRRRRE